MLYRPLSIYIHWPFCKSKCPYCDFFKRVQKNIPQTEIIDSYITELEYYKQLLPNRPIRSVFFGGGTPSLIAPDNIKKILDKINSLWSITPDTEISLEANPNSEYPDMFKQLHQAGINRLSLGVQALNQQDLKFLGRTHSLEQARHSIEHVLTHFDNHSIDLIYARPNQTADSWQKELELAVSFGFKHLSLYQLTIEEGTVFASKGIQSLEEEKAVLMYQQTTDFLRTHGYPRYEVSNYAAQDFESSHNKCYWEGGDYIGLGESAHGRFQINSRFFAQTHPHILEELSPAERAEELIIMGIRLQKGIDKQQFKQNCSLEFDHFVSSKAIRELSTLGLIKNTENSLAATDQGFMVLNKIIEELCA